MVNADDLTVTVTPGADYTAQPGGGFQLTDDGAATATVDTTSGDRRLRLQLDP
jgi:hypothetical protein